MTRRALLIGAAAAVFVAGCAADDDGPSGTARGSQGPLPTAMWGQAASTDEAPIAGFTLVTSFDEVDDGYWVPVAGIGRHIEPVRGAYWEFAMADGEPQITGSDGCNRFDNDRGGDDPPPAFVDGRMIDVSTSHTGMACEYQTSRVVPEDGARFWIDATGDQLVVSTDGSEVYVLFEHVDELPSRLTPEEEQAQIEEIDEAQALQELSRQAESEARSALASAQREQLRAELPIARRRWESARPANYETRLTVGCLECRSFPPPDPAGGQAVVTVVDGSADSPWNDAITGATVDDWFDFLEEQLDVGYVVAAHFDPGRGYPTDIRYVSRLWDGPDQEVPYDDWFFRDMVVEPASGWPGAGTDGVQDDPLVAVQLRLDGLGEHTFGDQQFMVEAMLTEALGPPEEVERGEAPLLTCLHWQCERATILRWPAAGLVVAFSDHFTSGLEAPEPSFAAWTVSGAQPWWPGSIPGPDPTATGAAGSTASPEVRLEFVNGVGLGSSAAELESAFPSTEFTAWNEGTWMPTGFYVPGTDGRTVLDGDVDWDVVSDLQTALNAHGAAIQVDGIAGPDTAAALTEYRERTGHDGAASAFASLGLDGPGPSAEVIRLSAGEWFWELDCGEYEVFGVPSEC